MSINNFPPASAKPATPLKSGTVFGLVEADNTNVALGYGSLKSNLYGGNNVSIGYNAGYNATGSANIFIGNSAGGEETGNYKLYIDYNNTSTPLIYGDFDARKLTINGSLRLERPVREKVYVVASAFAGYTLNFQSNGAIHYLTSDALSNGTVNIRPEFGVTTDSWLDTGDSFTVVLQITNGSTAYYPTAWQIDGTTVTPKWQGGTAPTGGNANAIDVYSLTITKTASATYTVLASQTKFA